MDNEQNLYEKYLKSKYVDFMDFNQYKEKVKYEPQIKTIANEIGEKFTCLCETKARLCSTDYAPRNLYFDCTKCKNDSWYDENYCNNQKFEVVSLPKKRDKYYCLNYSLRSQYE